MIVVGIIVSIVLLACGLAMYLIAPRIGPNPWFGFRMGYTLIDREVWDKSNKYAGKLMTLGGLTLLIISLMLGNDLDTNLPVLLIATILIIVIVIVPSIVYAIRIAEQESARKPDKQGKITPIKPVTLPQIYIVAPVVVYSILIMVSTIFYDQLPGNVATHFDPKGNPNYWMSKFNATLFALGFGGLFFGINIAFIVIGKKVPMLFYPGKLTLQRDDLLKFACMMMTTPLGVLILSQIYIICYNLNGCHLISIWSYIFAIFVIVVIPIIWLARQIHRTRRWRSK
ncbi:MAG: SdpI family protein [Candidatus Thermoplasmatota archaeon]